MGLNLTEGELEILQIMWKTNQCSVRNVYEELIKFKDTGYTTTLKLMQIMHNKGLVKRDASARVHLYSAVITQKEAQNTAIDKIIDTVFKGSAVDLVIEALGQHRASGDEIDFIKDYLKKFDKLKK